MGMFFPSTSQTLKTYSGKYDNGTASYSYYEENDQRIYQGDFKYEEKDEFNSFNVKGSFTKGKKSGVWLFTRTQASGTFLGTKYNGYIENASINFVNGKREGACSLKKVENKTGKILKEITCNFSNNQISGNYKATLSSDEKCKMEFNVNPNNELDGVYTYEYTKEGIPFTIKNIYKNGVRSLHSTINNSTGEILEKQDYTNLVSKFVPLNSFLILPEEGIMEYHYKQYSDNKQMPNKLDQFVIESNKPYFLLDNSNASEPSMHTLFLDGVLFKIENGMEAFYRPKEYLIRSSEEESDGDNVMETYNYLMSKDKQNKKTENQNLGLNQLLKTGDALFNNQKYLESFETYRKYSNQIADNDNIQENPGYEKKVDSIIEIESSNRYSKATSYYNNGDLKNARMQLDTLKKFYSYHSSSEFQNNYGTKAGLLIRDIQDVEKIETTTLNYQTDLQKFFNDNVDNAKANEALKLCYDKVYSHYTSKGSVDKYKKSLTFLSQVQKNIVDRGGFMLLNGTFIKNLKVEDEAGTLAMKIYSYR